MCPACQICLSTLHGTFISITHFAMTCIHGRHKLLNNFIFYALLLFVYTGALRVRSICPPFQEKIVGPLLQLIS